MVNERNEPATAPTTRTMMMPVAATFMAIAMFDDARQGAQDVADEANGYAVSLARAGHRSISFLTPAATATNGEIIYVLPVQCQANDILPVTSSISAPAIRPFTVVGNIGAGNFAQQATNQANSYIAQTAKSGDGKTGFSVCTTTITAYDGKIATTIWVVTYP